MACDDKENTQNQTSKGKKNQDQNKLNADLLKYEIKVASSVNRSHPLCALYQNGKKWEKGRKLGD